MHLDNPFGARRYHREVGGDQFVSECALTTRTKEIRRAIGDDGTQQSLVRNVRAPDSWASSFPTEGRSGRRSSDGPT